MHYVCIRICISHLIYRLHQHRGNSLSPTTSRTPDANSLRMKDKAGKRIPGDLVKAVLLGEYAEGVSVLSKEEKAEWMTPKILEEVGPALKKSLAREVKGIKRRAEVTLKQSPPKRPRK